MRFIQQAGEEGVEISRRGTLGPSSGKAPAVYDFHLKMGSLAPPGAGEKGRAGGRVSYEGDACGPRAVEPVVDLFEDPGWLIVVAQLPGTAEQELKLVVEGSALVIGGGEGERRYTCRVPLPFPPVLERCQVSFTNGVLELRIPTENGAEQGSAKGDDPWPS